MNCKDEDDDDDDDEGEVCWDGVCGRRHCRADCVEFLCVKFPFYTLAGKKLTQADDERD
jgi:hypothetical protein